MFHLMSRRPWTQARAVLLLATFLLAGSSLPSLDALLYHTQATRFQDWQIHLEAAGDCPSHTEHCTLGRTAPGSGAVAALSDAPQVAWLGEPAPKSFVTQNLTGSHPTAHAQPRAPPVSRLV